MAQRLAVLIVEDEPLIAVDLAFAVEERGWRVIGPVASVHEGLSLAEGPGLSAAILDANLVDRDVTPLARRLVEQNIPIVILTGTGLPEELAQTHPHLPVMLKPIPSEQVLCLLAELFHALRAPVATVPPDESGRDEGMRA